MLRKTDKKILLTTAAIAMVFAAFPMDATAQDDQPSSLIITSGPVPESLRQNIYSKPIEIREITAKEILSNAYYDGETTLISSQVRELAARLGQIQQRTTALSGDLSQLQRSNERRSSE